MRSTHLAPPTIMAAPSVPIALLSSLFLLAFGRCNGIYVYEGNPYDPGKLDTITMTVTETLDRSPAHMNVHFPTVPGTYVPVFFIGGFFGVIFSEWYSNVLNQIAQHGFIVIGVDPEYPTIELGQTRSMWWREHGEQGAQAEPERLFRTLDWLVENLPQKLAHQGYMGVIPEWSLLALSGHSAGADPLIRMAAQNSTVAKSLVFLEPCSFTYKTPLNYSIPALSYGTQFIDQFPPCCFKGADFQLFYELFQCPRIKMNVTGFGHCDILNEVNWETCHLLNFCKTDKANDRVFYHSFISGVVTSFLGAYLQGRADILDYITSKELIPAQLSELATDIDCMSRTSLSV